MACHQGTLCANGGNVLEKLQYFGQASEDSHSASAGLPRRWKRRSDTRDFTSRPRELKRHFHVLLLSLLEPFRPNMTFEMLVEKQDAGGTSENPNFA